ncbi:glycosyltransferase family 2 protein [Streptomyces cyaneofuscatus]|uniref:glycosyltransferase family 2 protein n=1 Tax=Streptomyces cyaneofuscatus TaxID=66883 RepID=UPI0039827630
MSTGASRPTVGAVVLTMNDRPEEFPRAMASLLAQEGVALDVVVVGNGCVPEQVPTGVRMVTLPENVGIPEGRNVGADHVKGDHLLFFDNDAHLPDADTLARLVAELRRDPQLAYVQPRISDPVTGVTLRRWVPGPRASDPARPGTVTVMAEGVVMVRRDAYDRAGGWPGDFFLFHEGVELAWRLWDLGCTGTPAARARGSPCPGEPCFGSPGRGDRQSCDSAISDGTWVQRASEKPLLDNGRPGPDSRVDRAGHLLSGQQ